MRLRWLLLPSLLWSGACSRSEPEFWIAAASDSNDREQAQETRCLGVGVDGELRLQVSGALAPVRADILFLLDNSSSMGDEIRNIAGQLMEDLIPAIRARTEDTAMGVATACDFGRRSAEITRPYRLRQAISEDDAEVLRALQAITLELGGDDPEAQLEALYQVATGEGVPEYVEPGPSCPAGTHGGACFRDQSYALVMLFTDAPMRNVQGMLPDGSLATDEIDDRDDPLRPNVPYLRGYDETIAALQREGIHVVGLWSGALGGLDDLRRIAHDTGALDERGEPVLFDIGHEGEALSDGVINTLDLARSGVLLSVALKRSDPEPDDGVDTTALVTAVRALSASPEGAAIANGAEFTSVREGAQVTFELVLDTTKVPPEHHGERLPLQLQIAASDGTLLWQERLELIVDAQGDACVEGS